MDQKRLPCGWLFRLPNFCKDRKCETCPLRKDKQKQTSNGQPASAGRKDGHHEHE